MKRNSRSSRASWAAAAAASLLLATAGCAGPGGGSPGRVRVLVFVTVDCPIANQVIPEINRIYESVRNRGVDFTLVHVDPDVTEEQARAHAKEYAIRAPYVLDPKHERVRATGVQRTPEAAVYDASGALAYRGRINDRFPRLGDARAQARVHDLRDAIEAVLAGRPVREPRTKVVGCTIPDPAP